MELSADALLELLLPDQLPLFGDPPQDPHVEGRRVRPDVDGGFEAEVTARPPDSVDFHA